MSYIYLRIFPSLVEMAWREGKVEEVIHMMEKFTMGEFAILPRWFQLDWQRVMIIGPDSTR